MKPQLAMLMMLAGLGGCADSTPAPNDQWSAAQEQVGRAQATAPGVPAAKLHLQLAEEDLQKSKGLIGSDNKRATTLIALATAEAQLATSLATAAQAQEAAQKAQDNLQGVGAHPINPPGASNLQAPNNSQPAPQMPSGK